MNLYKSLILIVGLAALVSAGASYYKYSVERDYLVFANVSCDPQAYSCFLGDGENTPEYYAVVSKKAGAIPLCDAWGGECKELACESDDASCSVEYCEPSEENVCIGPSDN